MEAVMVASTGSKYYLLEAIDQGRPVILMCLMQFITIQGAVNDFYGQILKLL